MKKYRAKKGNYKKYHGSKSEKLKRASRNAARRKMMKAGKVKKGDNNHIDHIDRNPLNSKRSNLRVLTRKQNLTRKKKKTRRKKK